MKVRQFFFALLLVSSLAYTQSPVASPTTSATVILVGTAHDLHLKPEMQYSLTDIRAELEALHPDVICGEITPEAYKARMEGYFPPEAAYIAELAPALHARFVPADWRITYTWQHRAEEMEPTDKQQQEAAIAKKQMDIINQRNGSSLFDALHSDPLLSLTDQLFEEVIGENTVSDIAAGGWHERNRRIVENCLDRAAGAQRIVILFGASHILQLRRQLLALGISPQIAKREFTPAGLGTVPPAVLARWQKNLANLRSIRDGASDASRDSVQKVRASHRVADLEEIIAIYSVEK